MTLVGPVKVEGFDLSDATVRIVQVDMQRSGAKTIAGFTAHVLKGPAAKQGFARRFENIEVTDDGSQGVRAQLYAYLRSLDDFKTARDA